MPETFTFALDGTDHEIAGDDATRALFESLVGQRDQLATENSEFKKQADEARDAARQTSVDAWLHAKKIVPAQVDGMKAYVLTCRTSSSRPQGAGRGQPGPRVHRSDRREPVG